MSSHNRILGLKGSIQVKFTFIHHKFSLDPVRNVFLQLHKPFPRIIFFIISNSLTNISQLFYLVQNYSYFQNKLFPTTRTLHHILQCLICNLYVISTYNFETEFPFPISLHQCTLSFFLLFIQCYTANIEKESNINKQ